MLRIRSTFRTRSACLSFTVVCFLLSISQAEAGLRIYYIRHAEGGHNVKKEWQGVVPEEEWPAFVGDHEQFTPKGKTQRIKAIKTLGDFEEAFDFIAVSPAWRAQHTILPYLKDAEAKGEIWPELQEIGASSLILSPELVAPTYKILGEGDPIELTAEEAPYFLLRSDGNNHFKVPRFRDKSEQDDKAAAHRFIIQSAIDRVKQGFDGSDKSILLVGHKGSGTGILRMLLNDSLREFPSMLNAGVWMVEQQPNGEFELRIFNDVPLQYESHGSDLRKAQPDLAKFL